jgi:hypothetical protein
MKTLKTSKKSREQHSTRRNRETIGRETAAQNIAEGTRQAVDFKAAAANDVPTAAETTLPLTAEQIVKQPERSERGSAVASGFQYNKLAGKPTKQQVIAVFGQSGYSAYSWVSRAAKLGITPEELCEKFVADPKAVKELWQKVTIKA